LVLISFQNNNEALKLLQFVSAHSLGGELQQYMICTPEQGLKLDLEERPIEKWLAMLTDVFHSFLVEEKLQSVLEQIIIQKFLYRERDEVDGILQIAASIFEGERNAARKPLFEEEKQIIKDGLQTILTRELSFSFDSFITFRLKSFHQSLEKYAMLAIDEYKLEQDYQSFIATLRDFLHKRTPKMPYLHLVYQDAFYFYDASYRKLERLEINELVDRHLLANSSIYIESVTLAPLLSIAPERLYIYTDDMEQGLIQTVKRIFEERSVVLPLNAFCMYND